MIFNAVALASIAALFWLHFGKSRERIAYVDSVKLLNGYQAMTDARKDYQAKATAWQSNVDTLLAEVQTAIQKYEKEAAGLSAKEKTLSQELIRTKQKQLADYQQAIAEKARQEDQRLTGDVLKQANSFLERYGKQHDFDIIFAANATGNIAYAEDYMDITELVLEQMNQEYGAPASAKPTTPVKPTSNPK
ncbi:MAG: OmpH family outer membrane protein [Cytophagales bacterium]|nr:OmpH family outer membrane protein [Cytophagales bacterium]